MDVYIDSPSLVLEDNGLKQVATKGYPFEVIVTKGTESINQNQLREGAEALGGEFRLVSIDGNEGYVSNVNDEINATTYANGNKYFFRIYSKDKSFGSSADQILSDIFKTVVL